MDQQASEDDPRGLIREAYAMDLNPSDARSVFLDWALGCDADRQRQAVERLLAHYALQFPDRAMTEVLKAALEDPPPAGRRGGARSRARERSK